MSDLIVLDKSNKHFSRFVELLRNQSEVRLVDIKRVVSRSSYYGVVIKKLVNMNQIMREINPKLFLAEPTFSVTKSRDVFTCVRRCELIQIESKPNFFTIRCKNEAETNPNPCNA